MSFQVPSAVLMFASTGFKALTKRQNISALKARGFASRIVHVSGYWVPETKASVSVFDRGFLFADSVYEVTAVVQRKLVDWEGHVVRLDRSLSEIDMKNPHTNAEWLDIHRELIEKNDMDLGLIYLQVSRGNDGDRDFLPPKDISNSVVMFTQDKPNLLDVPEKGMHIVTVPDLRWGRRDIKTTQLLYPVLAKEQARKQGADDAWMVQERTDGTHVITEGTSNNAFIITQDGALRTKPLSHKILPGITRITVLKLVKEMGLTLDERPFTVEEAHNAKEAFLTSTSAMVMPVVKIDNAIIGDGKPGPIVSKLRELYLETIQQTAT